jgi:hypothetical protein
VLLNLPEKHTLNLLKHADKCGIRQTEIDFIGFIIIGQADYSKKGFRIKHKLKIIQGLGH